MRRRNLRNYFAFLLISAAILLVALYALIVSEESVVGYFRNRMISSDSILRILKLAISASLALIAVRAVGAFIFDFALRLRRRYEAPSLIRNIFSIVAFVILFVSIFNHYYPAVNLGALFTTSAIFGVIIGLALQDTLGNLFAGLSLHADNPFQVGDVITVGQQKTGVVESITWRAVKIRTFQNHIILVSNSTVAKEALEVCPRDNDNARLLFFSTTYVDSPAKTIHVVREAVREVDNVLKKITPIVRIRGLGESTVDYELKYWLENYARYNDTDALVRQRIWYAFRRARLHFGAPTRTVHFHRETAAESARTNGRGFVERLAAVDIFAPLSPEEISALSSAATRQVFAPGELVIRAGDKGSSMFVVHRGRVRVQVNDNGAMRSVATLGEGDFFGEMGLFTGEPRSANVVAVDEAEVLEIGHTAMKQLFETNPDLVESLSHTIAERRASLEAHQAVGPTGEEAHVGLLASIKRFFGLG